MSEEKDRDQSEIAQDGSLPEMETPQTDAFHMSASDSNTENPTDGKPWGAEDSDKTHRSDKSSHHHHAHGSHSHHHHSNTTKPSKRHMPIWLKVVTIVVSILIVAGAGAWIFTQIQLNKLNKYDPDAVITVPPESEDFETDDNAGLDTVDPDSVDWPADIDLSIADHLTNILLIGQDTRNEYETGRSDSMMILSINRETNTISLTSLMRDMYVQIPGYSDNRINAAYRFGGYELLQATIEKNFGVKTDAFVEVDFTAFKEIVDIVGGVDVELTEAEAEYISRNWGVSAGLSHLDGKRALEYCRIRYVGNADYERTDRQRKVLTQVYNQLKSDMSPKKLLELIDQIFPLITTNMSNNEILSLSFTLYKLNISNIDSYRIPADGAFYSASIRGMSVLVPDLEANRKILQDILAGTSDTTDTTVTAETTEAEK